MSEPETYVEAYQRWLGGLAKQVSALGPGPRAHLRRWRPDRAELSPAFWRTFVTRPPQEDAGRGEALYPNEVARIALLLALLAETDGLHRGAQEGAPTLGRALADCGFSEARLVRLLDAPESARSDALLKTAGFLAAKAQPFQPTDLIHFSCPQSEAALEWRRLKIARDYYAALDAAAKTEGA